VDAFVSRLTMSRAIVRRLLDHVEAAADAAGGVTLSAAVCDQSGVILGLMCTDGARPHNVTLARLKAQTAASFGIPTSAWQDMSGGGTELFLGLVAGLGQVALFGGGVPVLVDGQIAGALGVSGPDEAQDRQFAEAAIASALS
jgi:glc operon protein GlcG